MSRETMAKAMDTTLLGDTSSGKLLGHAHLNTTGRYLRMARPGLSAGDDALALLSQLPLKLKGLG